MTYTNEDEIHIEIYRWVVRLLHTTTGHHLLSPFLKNPPKRLDFFK